MGKPEKLAQKIARMEKYIQMSQESSQEPDDDDYPVKPKCEGPQANGTTTVEIEIDSKGKGKGKSNEAKDERKAKKQEAKMQRSLLKDNEKKEHRLEKQLDKLEWLKIKKNDLDEKRRRKEEARMEKIRKRKRHNFAHYGFAEIAIGSAATAFGGASLGFKDEGSHYGVGIWAGVLIIIAGSMARKVYKSELMKRIAYGLTFLAAFSAISMSGIGGKAAYDDAMLINATRHQHSQFTTPQPTPSVAINTTTDVESTLNATGGNLTTDDVIGDEVPAIDYTHIVLDSFICILGVLEMMMVGVRIKAFTTKKPVNLEPATPYSPTPGPSYLKSLEMQKMAPPAYDA